MKKILLSVQQLGLVSLAVIAGSSALAQNGPPPSEYRGVSTAVRSDVSPPLRDIPPVPYVPGSKAENEERDCDLAGPLGPMEPFDPVAQFRIADQATAMPATIVSFNGFANSCGGCAPPDPCGDVGPNHYLAMANSTLAVYDKTGGVLLSPRNINTLWSGFGGACQTENAGDPVVLYDQFADRWLVSQFTAAGPTYYNCVALSVTGDPTGSYQRYAFTTGTNFPDYPKYGIWADGYYIATREFAGSPFAGIGAYALNRAQMLAGSLTPQVISFLAPPGGTPYNTGDGLLPADIDGSTLPPAGSPQIYLGSMDNGGPYGAPLDAITLWKYHVDWATPANSTFVLSNTIPVAGFDSTFTPCGGTRACIPQSGTANDLDILSYRQRLLHRAAYRNFGTYQTIVTNQSVQGVSSPSAIAGVRWYELRDPNGSPAIYQQGTYVPGATDGIHRWMGSMAMDKVGEIALGFSASNASMFPSIWYTGRLPSDTLGQLPQGEGTIVNGAGSQTAGGNRWGDYTSMNVDPTDDCTFWYISEFYTATSSATWRLRIGSFKYPTCCNAPGAPALGVPTAACSGVSLSWTPGSGSTSSYNVYRANGSCPGSGYTKISGPLAGTTFNDATAISGTTYSYVIRGACDATGFAESPDSTCRTVTATGTPLAPTAVSSTNACNQITVSWTNGAGATTHDVLRYDGACPSAVGLTTFTGVTTPYVDSTVSQGSSYCYVVKSVNSCGTNLVAGFTGIAVSNQTFHLQVQSTSAPGDKDLTTSTGFEGSVQQLSTSNVTAAGEFAIGGTPIEWATAAYAKTTDLGSGPWTFDVYGLTTNPGLSGQLYAKIYRYNSGSPVLLFTTGYASPNVSTAGARTRFTWTYQPPTGTNLSLGDRAVVEIWLHATTGSTGSTAIVNDVANADATAVKGTVAGSYVNTQSCNASSETIKETNVAGVRSLDHVWSIPLTTGLAHTLTAVAWVNSAAQNIALEWGTSTTGPWTTMFNVTKSASPGCGAPQTFVLPSAQTGTIYIHAVTVTPDTTLDTLSLDFLAVVTTIPVLPPFFTLDYDFAAADSLVTSADCAPLAGSTPKRTPDGTAATTASKWTKVDAAATSTVVTWDVTKCVPVSPQNYDVIYGWGSGISTYTLAGAACGIGRTASFGWTTTPAVPGGESLLWWLIVETNGASLEGSWGLDGGGAEIKGASPSNQCGMTSRTNLSCP